MSFIQSIPSKDRENFLKNYLNNNNKNIVISNVSEFDVRTRKKKIELNYNFEINNHLINLGNELYFSSETNYFLKDLVFDKDRSLPYEFKESVFYENETNIELPLGWQVEYLPQEIDISTEKYQFHLKYLKTHNGIKNHQRITIKGSILSVEEFDDWNSAINQLSDFYNDQIILTKL